MANNRTRWEADDPPNTLLAIDPGASFPKSKVPYAGAALFQWGMMVWCDLIKCSTVAAPFARANTLVRKVCEEARIARHSKALGEGVTVLVVEKPLIYKRGKARPADILALREIYGAFIGGIDAEFYSGPSPQEWKGSIDNKILQERTLTVANSAEKMILIRSGSSEHTIAAMGLGFWTLGRMGTAGVV